MKLFDSGMSSTKRAHTRYFCLSVCVWLYGFFALKAQTAMHFSQKVGYAWRFLFLGTECVVNFFTTEQNLLAKHVQLYVTFTTER